MSMISAQVDRLRERAKALRQGRWSDGPEDAKLMEGAADTIWELRNKLAGTVDMRERARLAEAENARLRELVCELYTCSKQTGCDQCRYRDGCGVFDKMAQLGIEV